MARLRALGMLGGHPHSAIEIEMTELEHGAGSSASCAAAGPAPEYAGSRGGPSCDERLRRRKGSDGLAEPPEASGGPSDGGVRLPLHALP